MYVVIYSPIQMAADLPENYEARREPFQFIIDVPADWEQSIALAGEVGDHVAFARRERGGDDWYLGALTGAKPRELDLSLNFLESGRRYVALIYRDGPNADWRSNPYDLVIQEREVTSKDRLRFPLAASGGAAIQLKAQ